MTLREEYGRKEMCWEMEQSPISNFELAPGEIVGFPFFALAMTSFSEGVLLLNWPMATVEIKGPKALDFYRDFSRNRANWIKADGKDIVSVTLITANVEPPAESVQRD